jgi:hypothetical protein
LVLRFEPPADIAHPISYEAAHRLAAAISEFQLLGFIKYIKIVYFAPHENELVYPYLGATDRDRNSEDEGSTRNNRYLSRGLVGGIEDNRWPVPYLRSGRYAMGDAPRLGLTGVPIFAVRTPT